MPDGFQWGTGGRESRAITLIQDLPYDSMLLQTDSSTTALPPTGRQTSVAQATTWVQYISTRGYPTKARQGMQPATHTTQISIIPTVLLCGHRQQRCSSEAAPAWFRPKNI